MVLNLKNSTGTYTITQLAESISLSGDIDQCTRTLSFEMLVSATDKSIPVVQCPLGALVTFSSNGKMLFLGYVFSKSKSTDGNTMTVTCFDRGIYLKKNQATYKFVNQTPEAIAKRVLSDFGIAIGSVISTGVKITRKFNAKSLYEIIETAYSLASEKNGKRYMIRFDGFGKCNIIEKVKTANTISLSGGLNIISSSYSESIENHVNRVKVTDKDGKVIKTLSDDSSIKLYGLFQEITSKSDKEDSTTKAKKILEDNAVERKITVDCLGDESYITGNTVIVKESFTGLNGLFWIDSDTHQWKNRVYTNKLTLNFKNMMDMQDAGEEVK